MLYKRDYGVAQHQRAHDITRVMSLLTAEQLDKLEEMA